ncbi:glycoside hydrolase family 18 protein [Pluteus cervinus]|uniref:Glycoside hydrolase family 18 protein n=1 Tax=Pluteus cervinus TaxID=181527 RepID=A0ACD3ABQ6_9AGAR|nr:glycoside hydrolase family 18 protein [Pluteus cervinus]
MAVLKRLLCLVALTMVVNASQAMRRPANYKSPSRIHEVEVEKRTAKGKASIGYFANWAIYSDFTPADVEPEHLTHILYSFGDTDQFNGTIYLSDPWADEQILFPGDPEDEPGNNMYGNLKQLYLLKLKQRNLKLLLSLGGWTYSQSGHFDFVVDPAARANFIASAVQIVEDYGFDGIDLDYEALTNEEQGQGFALLIQDLRTAFDKLARKKKDKTPYLVTAATGAGSNEFLNLTALNQGLDYFNLMAYDFSGEWSEVTDNLANLYGGERSGVSGDGAIQQYLEKGVPAHKITLGMPIYGRSFLNTDGIGSPYDGIGSGENNYNSLPPTNAQIYENFTDVTSYSYDNVTRELISYDTPGIVKKKASYINKQGLGGAMFWEAIRKEQIHLSPTAQKC